jgi:hypothetical protein
MWLIYVLVALAGAVILALTGLWPIALILLVAAMVLGVVALTRGSGRRIAQVDAPSNIPTSRESSYEPRVDPSRGATGSSTGT